MNYHPKLVMGYRALSECLPGFPIKRLRELVREGVIPYKRMGKRTVVFNLHSVEDALERYIDNFEESRRA